jgi:hypothetical protein
MPSCYLGETIASGVTPPTWHLDECFWDSRTGQSPLMQLCRSCRECLAAIKAPLTAFTRVGANPSDTRFGEIDYAGHPEWNPAQDFYTILTELHQRIGTDMLGVYVDPLTCKRWRYHPSASATAVRQAYMEKIYVTWPVLGTPVFKLNFALQEDWFAIMEAMRDALEAYAALQKKSDPWTLTVAGPFVANADISWPSLSSPSGTYLKGGLVPLPAPGQPYYTTVSGGRVYWGVDLSGGKQRYENIDFGIGKESGNGYSIAQFGFAVGIGAADNDPSLWSGNVRLPTGSGYVDGDHPPPSDYVQVGWFKQKTRTVRISLNLSTIPTPLRSALVGKTFAWTAQLRDRSTVNPFPLPYTATPASGTFVVTSTGTSPAYVDVVFDITDDSSVTGPPFVGGSYHDDGVWMKEAGTPYITLTPNVYNFCLTACNTYVNATP